VSPRRALALLVVVILFWGANWPIMKVGIAMSAPLTFVCLRTAIAAACMAAVLAAIGRLHWPTRRDWPIVLSVGVLQIAGFLGFASAGVQFVEAGRSAILAYTTPLWVVPGAALFLGERTSPRKLAGVGLGLAGVAVLFNPIALDWSDGRQMLGHALLMAAAFSWAIQILQIRGHRWDSPPLELAAWQYLVAALVTLPLALVLEADRPIAWAAPEFLAILAYNGVIATAFGFFAVITINRALSAVTTSLAMLGVPAAGLVFAALWLGETIDLTKAAGLALIAGGLALVTLAERRARIGG
jgi:drug/metabolite transporter (DMT)-like permease